MHDGNGRWIVFNGEIFNYIELRREVQTMGHQFKIACDTEVILHVAEVVHIFLVWHPETHSALRCVPAQGVRRCWPLPILFGRITS
jgi:glutamine phosphoribosylpyrophosphate amidotransferase